MALGKNPKKNGARKITALYLDENPEICLLVGQCLNQLDVLVEFAHSIEQINTTNLSGFTLIISDYRFGITTNGIEVLRELSSKNAAAICILVAEQSDENLLINALRSGVFDFVLKDQHFAKNLIPVVNRALDLLSKEEENRSVDMRRQSFALIGEILHSAEIDYWLSSETNPLENKVPTNFFKQLGFKVDTPNDF